MKKKINSRAKGCRGELEWASALRSYGYSDAIRGQQHSGSPDSPDVKCDSLAQIHWEVKRVNKLNLSKAYSQCRIDAGDNQTPIVAHRRDREEWLITLSAKDFLEILDGAKKPGQHGQTHSGDKTEEHQQEDGEDKPD